MNTVTHVVQNTPIIDFKCTLRNHLACLGIILLKPVSYPPAGRLVHYQQNWLKDHWVLDTIQGYLIDFSTSPHQPVILHCPHYTAEQTHWSQRCQITELLQKVAIEEIMHIKKTGFTQTSFLFQERRRAMPDNQSQSPKQFWGKQHFEMEGIHTLKDLLRKGDWLAKIDLKDAFFSIPIHRNHKKFLRFTFKDKTYRFNCLPFSLSSASWVLTKTLKPVLAIVRERYVCLIAYIDNLLILGVDPRSHDRNAVPTRVSRIHCAHQEVSVKVIEFLGLTVDNHGNQASSNQNQTNTSGSLQANTAEFGVSSHACTATRQDERHKLCPFTRAPILSPPTDGTLEQSSQCCKAQVLLTQDCLEEQSYLSYLSLHICLLTPFWGIFVNEILIEHTSITILIEHTLQF